MMVALIVAGCSTSYHSTGITGGYSETRLAPDVFRVSFRGNGYTSAEKAQDFALLRSAELATQYGFNFIAVIDQQNTTSTHTFTTAAQAQTTGTAYMYGNYATYSGQTTYTPGETYTFYKPKSGLLVQCFKSKPDGIFTFDVAFLLQSLRQKYHVK